MSNAITPFEGANAALKRHDGQRRTLTTRLASAWRPKADLREMTAEVIHARSGTSLNSMTVLNGEHTPSLIATWALNEGEEFMRGGGEAAAQQFHLLFDSLRIGFWMYPEGGESGDQMAAALVDSVLQSGQAKDALVYDTIQRIMGMQESTIEKLSSVITQKDKTIGEFLASQMKYANEYAALQDQKHLRNLETHRLEKSEERKDMAAEKFIGMLDKVTGIGGAALVQKMEKKLLDSDPIDQLASLLKPEEKEALGALIAVAMARSKGKEVPAVKIQVEATIVANPEPEKATQAPETPETPVAVPTPPEETHT